MKSPHANRRWITKLHFTTTNGPISLLMHGIQSSNIAVRRRINAQSFQSVLIVSECNFSENDVSAQSPQNYGHSSAYSIELNYMSNCFWEKSMEESIVRLLQWTWMQIVQVEWTILIIAWLSLWMSAVTAPKSTYRLTVEKANSKTTTKSQTRIARKVLC